MISGATGRQIAWGPVILIGIGVGVLALGARGFHARGHFGFWDALRCGLLLVPAAIYLLVTSYVIQHARLVGIIPLVTGGMEIVAHPSFAIALGLALLGTVVNPVLGEWRDAKRRDAQKRA